MAASIHSKKIRVGKLDIHYLSGGQGEPLVVVHGGSKGARAWEKNMIELCEKYTVYVPDLPGFGLSQPMEGDYFIPELIDFLDEFARSLGLERFHLMGHSLGGGIALSYALKYPDKVVKLVLVSSLCLGKEIAPWVRYLSSKHFCRASGEMAIAILKCVKWVYNFFFAPVEFVEPICRASIQLGSCVTTLKEQTTILLDRLSEIMVPTLVVWGARDPIIPFRHAYAAARLIPDCQVKVFENCGHSVYREEIHQFSQLLTGFLG